MIGRRAGAGLAGLALVLVGCGSAAAPSPSVTSSPTAEATQTAAAVATATVTPRPAASSLYDPAADAAAEIDKALAAAKADGKDVLIDFGADWCPDCVALSRMMETPAFKAWLDSVHVVRVDVGMWNHNMDLSAKYANAAKQGIPAVVLVSPTGEILDSTADGRLANAATMSPDAVLQVLESLGK